MGFADVWKRGFFGWEYKGPGKSLDQAYLQLLEYREDLENPPLLVVSDLQRIIIHTNFTGSAKQKHVLELEDLREPGKLELLRAVFFEPQRLHPMATSEALTQQAAGTIAAIAERMRKRGLDPHEVARFLDRVIFCLFAEDVGLLPKGLFTRLIETAREKGGFELMARQLFETMAGGGFFGADPIRHFNGDLFANGTVLAPCAEDLEALREAARLNWSALEPSIFGTLFERGLDPGKRSQLGAHYTSRRDIETLVDPVVMAPLRREWDECRELILRLLTTGQKQPGAPPKGLNGAGLRKARAEGEVILNRFHDSLPRLKVLDPACGSGNFLYLTLQKLKDLEEEVLGFAREHGFGGMIPMVGPWQLYGIEINTYAYELAQLTVWIGYLQWLRAHGYGVTDPILRPMRDNFRNADAILDLSDPQHPREPEWPRADFIVGNPPFLGDKLMRGSLGDEYVAGLRAHYGGRIPGGADLCCYWFERARAMIESGRLRRAGLLSTNSIRMGANREVLSRIKNSGDIFMAWSDRPWALEGAAVRVSLVGFDDGGERCRFLNGAPVDEIHPDLTGKLDVTNAVPLRENGGICFLGVMKGGAFDIDENMAREMLRAPANTNGRPNSDVVRMRLGGQDVAGRGRNAWEVDFIDLPEDAAAHYELPFEYVRLHVKPARDLNRDAGMKSKWWLHGRSRPDLRRALAGKQRCIVTPEVTKHRVFAWMATPVIADHKLHVFARDDDYFFGLLHSRAHELWSLAQCSWLGVGNDPSYSSSRTFLTFAAPWKPREEPAEDPRLDAVAAAAGELTERRHRWLNPPEWTREEVLEFPGAADGPWARYVHDPDERGIGTVRYPRIVARDEECARHLAKRTLTNLYNERPAWLDAAHRKLDEAVFAAYGWPADLGDEVILERLLELNLARAAAEGDTG